MGRIGMVTQPDKHTWAPRVLAPLAFFTAATILVLLINSSLNADTDGDASSPPTVTRVTGGANRGSEATTTAGGRPQRKQFYRVREGDILETIAARFDTSIEDLLQLNPGIDPNSLTPGQRVRVR
jgi:LysM repeat protein